VKVPDRVICIVKKINTEYKKPSLQMAFSIIYGCYYNSAFFFCRCR